MLLLETAGLHFEHLGDVALIVGPAFFFLWKAIRRIELSVGLSKQTAKLHLPFIYERLGVHDEALNIHSPEHPVIGIVNGNGI